MEIIQGYFSAVYHLITLRNLVKLYIVHMMNLEWLSSERSVTHEAVKYTHAIIVLEIYFAWL